MNHVHNILEELAVTLLGLRMNILCKNEIVEFSDQAIAVKEAPDSLFITIALNSSDLNVILNELGDFIASNKSAIDTDKLLGVIYALSKHKALSVKEIVSLLYLMGNEFQVAESIQQEIHRLNDQYHLVFNRHVTQTMPQLNDEVQAFLLSHSDDSVRLNIFK